MCDELDQSTRSLLQRLTRRRHNLKVNGGSCSRCDSIDFPCRCLPDSNFSLSYASRLLACGDCMTDKAGDFKFFCSLNQSDL